jgi:hypothetical protein
MSAVPPAISAVREAGARAKPGFDWRTAAALAVLLAAVTALFATTPYDKDMWWSDAPRHAMDGAFYRDLLRHMPLGHLKQFAMNYYLKYPALTILFYPPLFPFVEGGFFGVFGVSLFTALLTVAAFYLALAWGAYVLCRRWMDRALALAASLVFIGAPEVAWWGRQVMLEIPACAFLIWSAVVFLKYLDTRKPAVAYALALLLAGGAYTKQTVLFIVPALIWTLWRRQGAGAFRDRHLWESAALFLALVLPLAVVNFTLARLNVGSVVGGNWNRIPVFSWEGWSFYARMLPAQLAWPVALAAAAGLALAATQRMRGEGEGFFGAWLVAGYVFFSLIALKEPRHTVTILLPLAFFAVEAVRRAAPARFAPALAMLFACAAFGNTIWRHPAPYVEGYGAAADFVVSRAPRGSVILFSGYRDGAFVFDVRRRVDRPDLWVLRADKLLLRVPQRRELGLEELNVSESQILEMIDRFGVSYVVNQANFWDDLKNMQEFQRVLHSSQFRKVATIPVASNVNHEDRDLEIYQNLAPAKVKVRERLRLELPIVGMQVEGTIDSTDAANPAPR